MRTQSHPTSTFSSIAFLTGLLFLPGSSVPAPSSGIQYAGSAYGSFANVAGGRVIAGKSFPVTMGPCGTLRPPVTGRNAGASVTARPSVVTGAIDNTVSATEVSGTRTSKTTSKAQSVNLLSGLITAVEVRAVSATSHDAAGFHTSGAGSSVVNLVVAGVPILVQPGPNTRVELAGIGHVILNEQIASIQPTSASLVVNMIHVVVTSPNPLLAVGTNIIVSHAKSRLLATNIAGTLDGFAYGSFVQQGKLLVSGLSALVQLGCNGTNGAVRTNSAATLDFQPAFANAVVTNTATGVVTSTSATGETTSTVEAADLLSSLVTADLIEAHAHSFTDGSTFTFTDTGTSFVNLSVRGFPDIKDGVPPNTRVALPGVGNLWLRRVIYRPNSIEVRMIEIVVNQANVYGIPIGTDIRVGVAHASAH